MFMINHNLNGKLWGYLLPDYYAIRTTNSVASIIANSDGCAVFSGGKATSFVMLDWVNVGTKMYVVDVLNGFRPRSHPAMAPP